MHQLPSRCPTSVSRLDLLHAIVVHHSVAIDAYHENTPDKSGYGGHFYSDKAPGTVALAFPAFVAGAAALHAAGETLDSEDGWLISSWIACMGSIGLVTAVGASLMFLWLINYVPPRHALITTLALFLGAAPLPYSTMMFSHALVVGLLAIAIWAIDYPALFPASFGSALERTKPTKAANPVSRSRVIVAGFCCGLALASEYTVGLVVVGLFAWYVSQFPLKYGAPASVASNAEPLSNQSCLRSPLAPETRRVMLRRLCRRAVTFSLAAIPPLLLIPLYSWLCFKKPLTLPYSLNVSFPEMKKGLYAIGWPDAEIAFNLLFTPTRGLFFWTPFLVMAGIGHWRLIRTDAGKFWLMYGVPLLQILVISGRSWDWPAGPTLGPRYLAPVLPLLALPCAFGVSRFPVVGTFVAAYSILITTVATLTNACPNASYYNPLTELHIPLLLQGALTPNLGLVIGVSPYLSIAIFYSLLIVAIACLWHGVAARIDC